MRAPKVTTTTILIGAGVGLTLIVELLVLQAAVQGLSVSDWVSTTSTVPTTSASAALNSGRLYNVTFVEGQDGFGNYYTEWGVTFGNLTTADQRDRF